MKFKTVSVLAAIVAVAMCVLPLLNADLSDATVLAPGDRAADFDAGGISDEDFNGLFTESYKNQVAFRTLQAIDADVAHTVGLDIVYDYEITDLVIENVTELKAAIGKKVTDDKISETFVRTLRCDISFTATRINCDGSLFTLRDGMQALYKELDYGNVIKVGSVLKLDGSVRLDESDSVETEVVKNGNSDYVITKSTEKLSEYKVFKGKVEYVYNYDAEDVTKNLGINTEFSYGGTIVTSMDYYDVSPEAVAATTKAISTTDYSDSAHKFRLMYLVGETQGGYEYRLGADRMAKHAGDPVLAGTAEELALIITTDIDVPEYYFYNETGDMRDNCLFNGTAIADAAYKSNDAMKERLGQLGHVGDRYDDAKSTADSAYNELNLDPVLRVDGLVAAVVIAVLTTAVIILGYTLFRKK